MCTFRLMGRTLLQQQETGEREQDQEHEVREKSGSEMAAAMASSCSEILTSAIDPQQPYPTDPALFKNTVLTTSTIRALISAGPCQPGSHDTYTDFALGADDRKFYVSWYTRATGTCNVERNWLVYSPTAHRAYCLYCWLFGDKQNCDIWSDPTKGLSSFHKGREMIEKHECNVRSR